MPGKRILYLDLARGLGIFLVVLGHIEAVNESLRGYVTSFHMPLFFAISGILMLEHMEEQKNFRQVVRKKFYSLLVPYFFFGLVSVAIEGVRLFVKHLDGWEALGRQLYQLLCFQGFSTLWFLPALFFAGSVFLWLRKKTSHACTIITAAALTAAAYGGNAAAQKYFLPLENVLPYALLYDVLSMVLRSIFCVCFICGGYYFAYVCRYLKQNKIREFICAVLLLIAVALLNGSSGHIDIRFMNLGNFFLCIGQTFGGMTGMLLLCKALENRIPGFAARLISYYGRNSLIVMVTHIDFRVLNCSIRLADWLNAFLGNHSIYCILIFVFVFAAEAVIIRCLHRFMKN